MKVKHYLFALMPLSVVGIGLRFFEIMFGIEPETGYYATGSVLPLITDAFSILCALFFVTALFLLPKEEKAQTDRLYLFFGIEPILILISAVGILAMGIIGFIGSAFSGDGYATVTDALKDTKFYILILTILGALYLTALATDPLKTLGKGFFKIISLSFAVFFAIRLFMLFVQESSILSHAYASYSIVFYGSATLFFMSFSKFVVRMPSSKSMVAYGLCTIFFGVIRISEFVLSFIGDNKYNLTVEIVPYIADFLILLFVGVILMHLSLDDIDFPAEYKKIDIGNLSEEDEDELEAGMIADAFSNSDTRYGYPGRPVDSDEDCNSVVREVSDGGKKKDNQD